MRFGAKVNYDDFIKDSLRFMGKISRDYITNRQVLTELYETVYRIQDHTVGGGALSGVKFNEPEKFMDHYLYESYLELYLYKSVRKYLGISFDDFLNRPRYEIEKMVDVLETFRQKEKEISDAAVQNLKDATNPKQ